MTCCASPDLRRVTPDRRVPGGVSLPSRRLLWRWWIGRCRSVYVEPYVRALRRVHLQRMIAPLRRGAAASSDCRPTPDRRLSLSLRFRPRGSDELAVWIASVFFFAAVPTEPVTSLCYITSPLSSPDIKPLGLPGVRRGADEGRREGQEAFPASLFPFLVIKWSDFPGWGGAVFVSSDAFLSPLQLIPVASLLLTRVQLLSSPIIPLHLAELAAAGREQSGRLCSHKHLCVS